MKLLVIGCGQCGGRVAEQFAKINIKARVERGIDIITAAYAVNTDVADLSGLSVIKADYNHRILIGGQKTGGHGVGKINELGAEIAREDSDKVISAIRTAQRFPETDAFLLIAGAGGGTGSGAISVLTQHLKERYIDSPVYNLIVLPFKYEEATEERTIYNVATCLKSAYLVADAIFLVDNQRYLRKESPINENMARINARIVEPFYNLLCAGEEKKAKYVGSKVIDGGDIIQTLSGWVAIGHSRVSLPKFKLPFDGHLDFREKAAGTKKGSQAMNQAINELSLKCNAAGAQRALYLLSAPPKEISMDILSEVSNCLKALAPNAVIRSGDYPRGKGAIDVTVILAELAHVGKVSEYFTKTITYISSVKRRREGIDYQQQGLETAFKDIPSLL